MTTTPNLLEGVDMDALALAVSNVRKYATGKDFTSFCHERTDAKLVMQEFDRMRDKLDSLSKGSTVLIMSDADRALPVLQLDDASLAAWTRSILAHIQPLVEKVEAAPVGTLLALHGIISMARIMENTNAGLGKFRVQGISDGDGLLGDWEVIVRKMDDTPTVMVPLSAIGINVILDSFPPTLLPEDDYAAVIEARNDISGAADEADDEDMVL